MSHLRELQDRLDAVGLEPVKLMRWICNDAVPLLGGLDGDLAKSALRTVLTELRDQRLDDIADSAVSDLNEHIAIYHTVPPLWLWLETWRNIVVQDHYYRSSIVNAKVCMIVWKGWEKALFLSFASDAEDEPIIAQAETPALVCSSQTIQEDTSAPKTPSVYVRAYHVVPEGRYAISGENGSDVTFVEVAHKIYGDRGVAFANHLVGAPGDWRVQTQPKAWGQKTLEYLVDHFAEAAQLYGSIHVECSFCGSPLSNLRSRASGVGEVCAHKHGMHYCSTAEAVELFERTNV